MLIYFSDFEINVNDWKEAKRGLEGFEKNVSKILCTSFISTLFLAHNWIEEMSSALMKVDDFPMRAKKSPWEICLEYMLLTYQQTKVLHQKC